MKFLLLLAFLSSFSPLAHSQPHERHETATIFSIDDLELPPNYLDASEDALPHDHHQKLIQLMGTFRFTILSDAKLNEIFDGLERNPRARMKRPGGACATRRAYIQRLLKKSNIVSGRLLLKCPANNGRLRLKDRSTRRYYTYSNFHDVNIMAVRTNAGHEYRVVDVQFEDAPVTLGDYLAEVENFQKVRPLKRKGAYKKTCYWSVSTPHFAY